MPPAPLPEPLLEGERVRLRPWRVSDADLLVAGWQDPEVRRWNPVPEDAGSERARRWIRGWERRRRSATSLDLVVVDVATGEAVGEVGAAVVDERRGGAEVGFWMLPSGRGRGLASEGVRLFSGWLGAQEGVRVVFARAAPANAAGAGVLAAAGFVRRGRSGEGTDVWQLDPRTR